MNTHQRFDNNFGESVRFEGCAARDLHHTLVHSVSLQNFDRLVLDLGADPATLRQRLDLEFPDLAPERDFVAYRDFLRTLHVCATDLDCPSFGLELAALQSDTPMLPVSLDLAMRNSRTIGDAYQYSSDHLQSYSPVLLTRIERFKVAPSRLISFEILLDRAPHQQQAVEHAIALLHHSVSAISNGAVRSRAIWFKHAALSDPSRYRQYFQTDVSFEMPASGVFLTEADWNWQVPNRNPHLYEVATSFIENQYPTPGQMLTRRVRSTILRTLGQGHCTNQGVADLLGLHPRTLQRRLRDEGTSFEDLRDRIRKDVALQYLAQSNLPLIRIAAMLGYSEQSVLTRSCYRWFAASPRQVRRGLAAGI